MSPAPRRRRGRLGLPHVHHRVTDSTNERARELGARGAPHGTLVTADEQAAGRGRQGRRWLAPPEGALLASTIVRGLDERDALLPLAAAVAVCEACEAVAAIRCSIKWPNDVLVDGRKLAGILIEGRPQEGWAVVGTGINVAVAADAFPPDLRSSATSLAIAGGEGGAGPSTVDALLADLLAALERTLDEPPAAVLGRWRERDALAGQPVRWERGEGRAAGVDERGALLVDTAAGRIALDAGEVHLERPEPSGASAG